MATVLVISDTHCPGMRRGYVEFLQRTAEKYTANRFVHIGDLVDWAAINYHERHPGLSNALREFHQATRQVQSIHRAFPRVDWLIGNHDALTERQARTAGIPEHLLRSYDDIWDVGWTVHPRFARLEIDGVSYAHGDSGRMGKDVAFVQAKDNFRSTVLGHFHSQAGVKWWANPDKLIFGMSVGCGIDAGALQFEYGRKFTAKPILGCGVVVGGKRAVFEPWILPSRG